MLYIITGLPYSGKTTMANYLASRNKWSITSVDEVLEGGNFDIPKMTMEQWNQVYTTAYDRLGSLLAKGETVIFDGGSLKRKERETLRSIAGSFGVKSKLIWVDTPVQLIKQRWTENEKLRTRGQLAPETLAAAIKMFEPPQEEEQPIIYSSGTDPEKWINNYFF